MTYDFCGYATRNNVKCSDGRVILKDAFRDDDGKKVPLVGITSTTARTLFSGMPSWKTGTMVFMHMPLSTTRIPASVLKSSSVTATLMR